MAQIDDKNEANNKNIYYNQQYDQNGQIADMADLEKDDFRTS